MMDTRKNFIIKWNRLTTRWNELVNIFTLTAEQYQESQIIMMDLNMLLKEDSYYFGFENLKIGEIIK